MTNACIEEFTQFEVLDDRLDAFYTLCSVQPEDQKLSHPSIEYYDTRTVNVPAELGVVWVSVYLDNTVIEPLGWAQFALSKVGNHCVNVRVDEAYRRRGVASAMYDFVEDFFGRKLEPSSTLSYQAQQFWVDRRTKLDASDS